MRVYNLTSSNLAFHKKNIPPNGGFEEFPELDEYISDRDRGLVSAKLIAFRELPRWWTAKQQAARQPIKVPAPPPDAVEPPVEVSVSVASKSKK